MIINLFQSLFEKIKSSIINNKYTLIFILTLFITLAAVCYKKYAAQKIETFDTKQAVTNREFAPLPPDAKQDSATLYYFYTTWCPVCKKTTPEFRAFQEETNGVVKGRNIIFKEIDCDEDTATADRFNITGYPTIKLVYNDKTYEYDAKPDRNILRTFLNEVFTN